MVLVLAEHQGGVFNKKTFEAITYGSKCAQAMGVGCAALIIGNANNPNEIGKYGAEKIFVINGIDHFDSAQYADTIAKVAENIGATLVVLNHSSKGKSVIGRLAVKMDAGSVSGVNGLIQKSDDGFLVKKPVFSGKAIANVKISGNKAIVSLMGNSIPVEENEKNASLEDLSPPSTSKLELISSQEVSGDIPLPEAEIVVSAGRGMKGPENWGIIEELASTLGAATACSRPVADADWRPHHEHVGQTGVAIRPNLYIAIGISGAIQHLAGVNSSKVIVVINKDPEAPFFKAANYGVVGDLFDVVPRLNEALKRFKS